MIEIVRPKTKEESEDGWTESPTAPRNFYREGDVSWWECDKCKLIYEPDDEVILAKKEGYKRLLCPNVIETTIGRFFKSKTRRICRSELLSSSEKWFRYYYVIKDL